MSAGDAFWMTVTELEVSVTGRATSAVKLVAILLRVAAADLEVLIDRLQVSCHACHRDVTVS
jgi:hypothetical protein